MHEADWKRVLEFREEDFRISAWPITPKGGQQVNHVTCDIIVEHTLTGVSIVMTLERSQSKNKNKAVHYLKVMLTEEAKCSNQQGD